MRDPAFNTVTKLPSGAAERLAGGAPVDALTDPAVDNLLPAAMAFWPVGAAFGSPDNVRDGEGSFWSSLMRVMLAPFVDLYRRAFLLAREASPRTLDQTLPDWEIEWGLPEGCMTGEQSRVERLAFLATKVLQVQPVTPDDFIALAALYGFEITIEEPAVFECGFSEVGGEHTVGDWRQEIYWIVTARDFAAYFFTTGESEIGFDPLFSLGEADQLLCILRRISPAWTLPIFKDYARQMVIGTYSGAALVTENGQALSRPLFILR